MVLRGVLTGFESPPLAAKVVDADGVEWRIPLANCHLSTESLGKDVRVETAIHLVGAAPATAAPATRTPQAEEKPWRAALPPVEEWMTFREWAVLMGISMSRCYQLRRDGRLDGAIETFPKPAGLRGHRNGVPMIRAGTDHRKPAANHIHSFKKKPNEAPEGWQTVAVYAAANGLESRYVSECCRTGRFADGATDSVGYGVGKWWIVRIGAECPPRREHRKKKDLPAKRRKMAPAEPGDQEDGRVATIASLSKVLDKLDESPGDGKLCKQLYRILFENLGGTELAKRFGSRSVVLRDGNATTADETRAIGLGRTLLTEWTDGMDDGSGGFVMPRRD